MAFKSILMHWFGGSGLGKKRLTYTYIFLNIFFFLNFTSLSNTYNSVQLSNTIMPSGKSVQNSKTYIPVYMGYVFSDILLCHLENNVLLLWHIQCLNCLMSFKSTMLNHQ